MKSAVFLILLGSLLTIASCQQRERMSDEIIPASAEQSGTANNDEATYGAQNVIDADYNTRAYPAPDQDGNYWIRLNLGQVHCVRQFIEIVRSGNHYQTWTCSDTLCTCDGSDCSTTSLTVSTVNSLPDNLPARTDCRYGNTVQINFQISTYYLEFAVIGTGEVEVVCPAGQYKTDVGDCANCGRNQYSLEGSDTCSNCPEGTGVEPGDGTSESDCTRLEVACPAGQYKTNDRDCVNCGRNQYSSEGSDTCSNCPEGTGVEPGEGTSESDCRMEQNSGESVAPAAILLMMSALAVYC